MGVPPVGIGGLTGAVVQFWETYIGKYIGVSGDEVNQYSVSNYVYEHDFNESKRTSQFFGNLCFCAAFLKQAENELKAAMGV